MKQLWLSIILVTLTLVSNADNKKPDPVRPLLRAASKEYDQGHFFEAINLYQEALSIDSTRSEAHYYLADCFRYLFNYRDALAHYQRVRASKASEYPLLTFHSGVVHKSLGNYPEAEKLLLAFSQSKAVKNSEEYAYWLLRANIELQGIAQAQSSPLTPAMGITVSRLPRPVNSIQHDFAAIPYRNLHQLLLTSTRSESKGNVYHQQHGGSFSDNFIIPLDSSHQLDHFPHNFSVINSTTDEGPGVLSSDGNTYYFSRIDKGRPVLFVSEFRNEKWTTPEALSIPINLPEYTAKHPAISISGDTLFFSSDRPGGYGEDDLWMSIRSEDEWQLPINLGSSINTPFRETSPHWNSKSHTLFFASNGHPGLGGYDLFIAPIAPSRLSSRAINLGSPFNSSYDDTYIWVGDSTGYITSNRGGNKVGFDIYEYHSSDLGNTLLLSFSSQPRWKTWARQLLQLSESTENEDIPNFFKELPSDEQKSMKQDIARRIFQTLQRENAPTLAEMEAAQQLAKLHGSKLEWLVNSQQMFLQGFQVVVWPDEVRQWYSTLPSEEKEKIKKATRALLQKKLIDQGSRELADEEGFQYDLLPSEQRQWIDQATERGIRQFQQATQEAVDLDLLYQWQTLDSEEKEQLQRQLTIRQFTQTAASYQSLDTLRYQYEQLSSEEQLQIDQLAHSLLFPSKDQKGTSFNEDVFSFQTYSPEEQKTIAQLVVYRLAQMKEHYATEVDMETIRWETLPSDAKNSVNRTAAYRQFTAHNPIDIPALEDSSSSIDLHAILQSNPEVLTIKGKLNSITPTDGAVIISLIGTEGRASTPLEADGSFSFQKVSYQGSPQLRIEPSSGGFAELLSTSLEELELTVEQDSQFVASFDNIYFETNQYKLNDAAVPILKRVANFHHKHPDVTIQVRAYADSVGSDAFNYNLSKRRGETVYEYLLSKQVATQAIKIVPQGKEVIHSSEDLSYSRRVEFVISGSNTRYNPTRKVYLLSANPSLEAIAKRYRITVDDLRSLNPGLPALPLPYSIIKVVTNHVVDEK